jgi:hypothetical protein
MHLLDLPSSDLPGDWPSASAVLKLVELITANQSTYSALPGELDPLDCSLVARSSKGRRHGSVRASIARSHHKLEEASRLVQARYSWRGYLTPGDDAPAGFEGRCAVTLIAETGGATVGTVTIGLDGPHGLLADQSYAEEVSALRARGRRVCELGRLALAEQADTKTVLSILFSLAYGVGKALQDVTDVFIEVNPRHVAFYRRVFGFVTDAGERFCERVQAPAVLLRTSVEQLEMRLRSYCSTSAGAATAKPALQEALAS